MPLAIGTGTLGTLQCVPRAPISNPTNQAANGLSIECPTLVPGTLVTHQLQAAAFYNTYPLYLQDCMNVN